MVAARAGADDLCRSGLLRPCKRGVMPLDLYIYDGTGRTSDDPKGHRLRYPLLPVRYYPLSTV